MQAPSSNTRVTPGLQSKAAAFTVTVFSSADQSALRKKKKENDGGAFWLWLVIYVQVQKKRHSILDSWLAVIHTSSGKMRINIEALHPQKCERKHLISTAWPFQPRAKTCPRETESISTNWRWRRPLCGILQGCLCKWKHSLWRRGGVWAWYGPGSWEHLRIVPV